LPENAHPIFFAILSLVIALTFATSNQAVAQTVELAAAIVAKVEVVSVDKADRKVTLLGPRGNVVEIEAGEQVRNFDQIKVGDILRVTYHEAVAHYIGTPGSQPSTDAAIVVARAPEGSTPGAMVAGAIDVSASVKGIDRKAREVTLELPNGNVVTHEVDPSVKAFDTLKVGDSIHARVTRSFAIAMDKL
jgi:Cu/Ag efflux protein CusF